MNITIFIAALVVMVILHELGHFAAAKATGMRVERFSLFFGRPLLSLRRGETEYRVGWAPLGGYVKISGMTPEEELADDVAPRAYYRQPTWKRIVVIAAGPAVNIACAFLLFCAFFMNGVPATTPVIAQVTPASAAASAGLKPQDRIIAIGEATVAEDGLDAVRQQIHTHPGRPVTVKVDRGGRIVSVTATPRSERGAGVLGISFASETARLGPLDALSASAQTVWWQTRTAGDGIRRLVTDSQAHKELTTVVGITGAYNEVADLGLALYFLGAVSLLLGLFNLLPLLPLDGGHILFAVLEKIRGGRRFSTRTYQAAMLAGLALMLVGMMFGLVNDAGRISSGSFLG